MQTNLISSKEKVIFPLEQVRTFNVRVLKDLNMIFVNNGIKM
jgi:hypothetical protein